MTVCLLSIPVSFGRLGSVNLRDIQEKAKAEEIAKNPVPTRLGVIPCRTSRPQTN